MAVVLQGEGSAIISITLLGHFRRAIFSSPIALMGIFGGGGGGGGAIFSSPRFFKRRGLYYTLYIIRCHVTFQASRTDSLYTLVSGPMPIREPSAGEGEKQ